MRENGRNKKNEPKKLSISFETLLPLAPNTSSKYPSLFTRVPLFEPTRDRTRSDTKTWGKDGGDFYHLGPLRIQRFGPGLSIYDEDTLISILQLGSERSIRGTRAVINQHLKSTDSSYEGDPNAIEEVYIGCVTSYRINAYLDRGTGGDQLKQCQESMDRLGLTQLLFYNDEQRQVGKTKFFDYVRHYDPEGEIYIKIDSFMVNLLKEYTTFDLTVRRQLSDVGKSCHRFFSGEVDDTFSICLNELMELIRYRNELKDFKRALIGRKPTARSKGEVGQLEIMKDLKWLEDFEISGTGRKSPFVLHAKRKPIVHNNAKILPPR